MNAQYLTSDERDNLYSIHSELMKLHGYVSNMVGARHDKNTTAGNLLDVEIGISNAMELISEAIDASRKAQYSD